MAHYRRSRRRSYNYGAYHVSQRQQLTYLFGGIDHDVEQAFFSLRTYELEALFREYGRKYGNSAEAYARRTFPKWKRGETTLSGQTAQRLLELLPPRLSKESRYDLIAKLRKHYLKRVSVSIVTSPESWRQEVEPAVEKVIANSRSFRLPNTLYERAAWLASGDSESVQQILRSIEEKEARQRTAYLHVEFQRIERFIDNIENARQASHTISLPQGDIHVTIQVDRPNAFGSWFGTRKHSMSKKSGELVPRDLLVKALALQQEHGNLLGQCVEDLPREMHEDLLRKLLEEEIRLKVSVAEARQRFENSTRDMSDLVRNIRELENASKSDYEIRSNFQTASGHTNLTVKKNNNTVIIVVAIVIGIILLVVLSS